MFNEKNFITVPGFAITELGLTGNELLCWSLVWGFSQDGNTYFRGSLLYIAEALGLSSREAARRVLSRLVAKGLLVRQPNVNDGVSSCGYAIPEGVIKSVTGCHQKYDESSSKIRRVVIKSKTVPSYFATRHLYIDNINNIEDNIEDKGGEGNFVSALPPSSTLTPEILMAAWNEGCGSLPKVMALPERRRRKCMDVCSGLREASASLGMSAIELWRRAVGAVARSPFCNGRNDRGWRANFDFLVSDVTRCIKAVEGGYDDCATTPLAKAEENHAAVLADISAGYGLTQSQNLFGLPSDKANG